MPWRLFLIVIENSRCSHLAGRRIDKKDGRERMQSNELTIRCVAPCLLGLESLIAQELREMGAIDVAAENGRVLFSGDANLLARANINCRFAERIQVLAGSFSAKTFDELFEGTKALAWEEWIGKEDAFPVKGYSIHSALFSVSDCQSIIKKAVVERLKSVYHIPWFEETGPVHQIQFSIMKDTVSLLLDTSGAGLHKRGYRLQANNAPLKETLSASLCSLARLRDYHTLYDPMCGSGTILIEGAMMALNIAPGVNRNFAAERWEALPQSAWARERERARDLVKKDVHFQAYGSDIDADALALAKANAERAGVRANIAWKEASLNDFAPATEKGTLICNPPYGERMLDIQQANELYRIMGKKFDKKRGWSYYIISPSEQFESLFGRRADKRRKLYNGMIKCQLYMYFK